MWKLHWISQFSCMLYLALCFILLFPVTINQKGQQTFTRSLRQMSILFFLMCLNTSPPLALIYFIISAYKGTLQLNFTSLTISESESCSVMSDSLQPHRLAHGILQDRILEWVAFPFSRASSQPRESSQPRDWNQDSHRAGRFFPSWVRGEAQEYWSG